MAPCFGLQAGPGPRLHPGPENAGPRCNPEKPSQIEGRANIRSCRFTHRGALPLQPGSYDPRDIL